MESAYVKSDNVCCSDTLGQLLLPLKKQQLVLLRQEQAGHEHLRALQGLNPITDTRMESAKRVHMRTPIYNFIPGMAPAGTCCVGSLPQ